MTESLQEDNESESTVATTTCQKAPVPSASTLSVSELVTTYQKAKKEEQDLTRKKISLQVTEKNLRSKIIEEIDDANETIKALKSEVTSLEDRCSELSRALGYQPSKII